MKEFRVISAPNTDALQERMNEFGKEGFDLIPHKQTETGLANGKHVFIVFMERTISETPQTEKEFKKFLEEHNDSERVEK